MASTVTSTVRRAAAGRPLGAGPSPDPDGEEHWGGLAARRKERVRRELGQAAMRLFVEHGYDGTTIEEIAAAVEVSPRTFYRYFPTKEHLVTALARTSMDSFCRELAARPPEEPLLASVRAAMVAAYGDYWRQVDHLRAVLRLLRQTPALRARWLDEAHHQQRQVADVLAGRLGEKPGSLRPAVVAGAVIVAWNTALEQWADEDGTRNPTNAVLAALATLSRPLLPVE